MLAGHLQIKNNTYYAVLNCQHRNGKRYPKWISTRIPAKKGNKRAANQILDQYRFSYNEYGELISEEKTTVFRRNADIEDIPETSIEEDGMGNKKPTPPPVSSICGNMLFADYMLSWLSFKETEIDPVTFAGYYDAVMNHVYPYFKKKGVTLNQLDSLQLKEFYKAERIGEAGNGHHAKKGTTVVRYHTSIHAALESAMADGLVSQNVAHRQRPTTEKFVGSFYMPEEAMECMRLAEGTKLELAVYFGLFYGLRRSEIVGLKWQNFDFERNTFTIAHTVTTYHKDGKLYTYAKDKTKNKSSMRTLPLVPMFREKLLALKKSQEQERALFKKSYSLEYLGYVYVDELGELIKPNYISTAFPKFLKSNGLRPIRFHDTRHSCASLLLRSGVSMKEIQAWLGHSDYSTTANLYAHLDLEDSMLQSADRLKQSLFGRTDKPQGSPVQAEPEEAVDKKHGSVQKYA